MIKIAFLDAKTVGEVANFKVLEKQGELKIYETTLPEEVVERCLDREVIIVNKVIINKAVMDQLPKLKMICVSATGTNNIDLEYAEKKGITVSNVAGYSTESVAQMTFTMLLYLINRPYYFDAYVKSGAWSKSNMFTHFGHPFWELNGKKMGIIGLGTIGRRVAQISQSFGMEVVFYSTTGRNNNINFKRFDLDTLLGTSDIVSIHAPLTEQTRGLINYEKMKMMRSCAILLNTGRGGIIVEQDLARALNNNIIGGAGIDVLEKEPIAPDHPLLKITDKEKLIITPHISWTSIEARQRLIDRVARNIDEFRKKNQLD